MSDLQPHVMVWPFAKAPEELRRMSKNGGDEDWLMVVPVGWDIPEIFDWRAFGCCCVDHYKHWSGATVVIGSHS